MLNPIIERQREHEKYTHAYEAPNYKMGLRRKADAVLELGRIPVRGSYLDVSCGKGEMLNEAERMGFKPVQGTEIVPALIDGNRVVRAEVHALPFMVKSFDVVSLLDVIEHLIPGDDLLACNELQRVARKYIYITANNKDSFNHLKQQLHINKRPYAVWDTLFRQWFTGKVTWLKGQRQHVSEGWTIEL